MFQVWRSMQQLNERLLNCKNDPYGATTIQITNHHSKSIVIL